MLEGGLPDLDALSRAVFVSAPDGIVVVDQGGRIVLLNSQAEKLFGYRPNELLQQSIEILVPEQLRRNHQNQRAGFMSAPRLRPMGAELGLKGVRKDGTLVPVEISLSPFQTEGVRLVCCIVRDVTERERIDGEKERLLFELWEALGKVKTLSGLLTICASCKKIRDDRGQWKAVEAYIRERSEAAFTHGLCPECMQKLYPES